MNVTKIKSIIKGIALVSNLVLTVFEAKGFISGLSNTTTSTGTSAEEELMPENTPSTEDYD